MAKVCEVCAKKPMSGNTISHAHNLTKRKFNANLRRVHAALPSGGNRSIRVCTRCLRSGLVNKASSATKRA